MIIGIFRWITFFHFSSLLKHNVIFGNVIALGNKGCPLNERLQFPYIAWPVVVHELVEGLFGKGFGLHFVGLAKF